MPKKRRTARQKAQDELNRQRFKQQWEKARQAAKKYGGKASEYVQGAYELKRQLKRNKKKQFDDEVKQAQSNDVSPYDSLIEHINRQLEYWQGSRGLGTILVKQFNEALNIINKAKQDNQPIYDFVLAMSATSPITDQYAEDGVIALVNIPKLYRAIYNYDNATIQRMYRNGEIKTFSSLDDDAVKDYLNYSDYRV